MKEVQVSRRRWEEIKGGRRVKEEVGRDRKLEAVRVTGSKGPKDQDILKSHSIMVGAGSANMHFYAVLYLVSYP